jgi:hypothetical protein
MSCIETGLPYHQQDNREFCGRAVAQMMLAGDKLGATIVAQHDMRSNPIRVAWGKLTSLFTGKLHWNTSPEDLAAILNQNATAHDFGVQFDRTRADGCQRIADVIIKTGTAVPAVVYGQAHWVVVTAVMLEGGDRPAPGPPYEIKGFFVNNPMPETVRGAHDPSDDCGRDGNVNGSPNTYVTLQSWREMYWNEPCTDLKDGPAFVTVTSAAQQLSGRASGAETEHAVSAAAAATTITAAEAVQVAALGMEEHGLKTTGPLRALLANATPFGAQGQNDDDGDGDPTFYRVNLVNGAEPVGFALVGARDGAFHGVQAPGSVKVPLNEPPSIVDDILNGSTTALRKFTTSVELTADLSSGKPAAIQKSLVWEPSQQSRSPFYSFICVNVSGKQWYVGMDGSAHRSLDPIHA